MLNAWDLDLAKLAFHDGLAPTTLLADTEGEASRGFWDYTTNGLGTHLTCVASLVAAKCALPRSFRVRLFSRGRRWSCWLAPTYAL